MSLDEHRLGFMMLIAFLTILKSMNSIDNYVMIDVILITFVG